MTGNSVGQSAVSFPSQYLDGVDRRGAPRRQQGSGGHRQHEDREGDERSTSGSRVLTPKTRDLSRREAKKAPVRPMVHPAAASFSPEKRTSETMPKRSDPRAKRM